MRVKDIVNLAFDFCHEDEIATIMRSDDPVFTEEQEAKLDSMTRAFNLVYEEVATQYIPITMTQKVTTDDGKVEFTKLSGRVLDIIEVRNNHNRKIRFRKFNDYIVTLANEVTILYTISPNNLPLSGVFSTTLPERVYAYGVAREYFYSIGVNDEGDIYDNRFKDSLLVLLGKTKEIVIPARRWI